MVRTTATTIDGTLVHASWYRPLAQRQMAAIQEQEAHRRHEAQGHGTPPNVLLVIRLAWPI